MHNPSVIVSIILTFFLIIPAAISITYAIRNKSGVRKLAISGITLIVVAGLSFAFGTHMSKVAESYTQIDNPEFQRAINLYVTLSVWNWIASMTALGIGISFFSTYLQKMANVSEAA